jgi:hypothetical protein
MCRLLITSALTLALGVVGVIAVASPAEAVRRDRSLMIVSRIMPTDMQNQYCTVVKNRTAHARWAILYPRGGHRDVVRVSARRRATLCVSVLHGNTPITLSTIRRGEARRTIIERRPVFRAVRLHDNEWFHTMGPYCDDPVGYLAGLNRTPRRMRLNLAIMRQGHTWQHVAHQWLRPGRRDYLLTSYARPIRYGEVFNARLTLTGGDRTVMVASNVQLRRKTRAQCR